MTHPFDRNDLAATTIALACCFGASHLLLGSAHQRLHRAEQLELHASATSAAAQLDATAFTGGIDHADAARRAIQSIEQANRLASNAAALYDEYARVANSLGLTIARMGPTSTPATTTRQPRARANPQNTNPPESHQPIAFLAEVEGPIDAIAAFLDTIERDMGHARMASVRLAPAGLRTTPQDTDAQPRVRATITTIHHHFQPPPEALRALAKLTAAPTNQTTDTAP